MSFVIYALATWRISSMFVDEPGPFRIFVKIRELVGITHDSDDQVEIIPSGFLPGIFSCVWCFSLWSGFFWTLVSLSSYGEMFALPFALSTCGILLHGISPFFQNR